MIETFSKKCQDSKIKTQTIPPVTATEKRAQRSMLNSMARSRIFCKVRPEARPWTWFCSARYAVSASFDFKSINLPAYCRLDRSARTLRGRSAPRSVNPLNSCDRLELRISFYQVVDRDSDFCAAAERRSRFAAPETVGADRVDSIRGRYIFDCIDEFRSILEIQFRELSDFGFRQRLLAHINIDRSGERLIAAVEHSLVRATYGALAAVYRHGLELFAVLDVIRKAKKSERINVIRYTLYQNVIVLARREVAAAGLGLSRDRFGEVIEGS